MTTFRAAKPQDIQEIQEIEKEYYEGFTCPGAVLKSWIEGLSGNFIIAEEDGKITGFIFFEYFTEVRAVPFVHRLAHQKEGKIVYVSEVGALNKNLNTMQQLFDKMAEKARKDGCETIIWLTGEKQAHDRIETALLEKNGFKRTGNIRRWEAFPGRFVDDHWIWERSLRSTKS